MDKRGLTRWLDGIANELDAHALEIWNHPEVAGNESYSAELFRKKLESHGFRIKNTDGVPHAFVASFGNGGPVIAVLGEYDALPGLSQKNAATAFEPVTPGAPGHGCGHNLIGTAALGAALALKQHLSESGLSGTVRFYGCPAEETLSGKVEMIRAGAFDGCDIALSWHPMTVNAAFDGSFLANNSIKFRFHGISSHAAQAPEAGRSALDAVELMNVGANYLREHVTEKARIHYTITNAGTAPNIIPPEAESWYYVRAPHRSDVEEITARLVKVAQGAATMTETTMDRRILSGCYEALGNRVLFELTLAAMRETELPEYTEEEMAYARALQESLPAESLNKERRKIGEGGTDCIFRRVMDDGMERMPMTASSDSGDVSWIMPMNLFNAATWPIGVPPHSWQATSASGSSVGFKGMLYAAKVLAAVGYDLLNNPARVAEAKAEFEERTKNRKYVCPLVD